VSYFRNIVRLILSEIFDSHELPNGYTENNGLFTFKNNDVEYYVRFETFSEVGKLMVPDDKILQKINNLNNKYIIDFGVIENESLNYNVKTNRNNPIEIIKYVSGIILKFVEGDDVDVLSYIPNSDTRDKMFNKLVDNFAQDFMRYRAKENSSYNVFLISKNSLK